MLEGQLFKYYTGKILYQLYTVQCIICFQEIICYEVMLLRRLERRVGLAWRLQYTLDCHLPLPRM